MACLCRDLVACRLRHHPLSSHWPQSPSDVVASSTVSVWSCRIVHRQRSAQRHCRRHHRCNPLPSAAHCLLLSRCPLAANSVTATPSSLHPLLLRRPTASARTSTLPLLPLMSRCSRRKTLMLRLTTQGLKKMKKKSFHGGHSSKKTVIAVLPLARKSPTPPQTTTSRVSKKIRIKRGSPFQPIDRPT